MKQLFTSRIPAVMALILFAAATFLNADGGRDSAAATMILSQPGQNSDNIASNR